jgi:hypothetical protein
MATQDDNARSADAAGDPPLTLDELAERERARREAADTSGARPSAGQELLLSGPTEREPQLEIRRHPAGWSLSVPEGFTWGLVASNGHDLPIGEAQPVRGAQARAYRPDGTEFVTRPPNVLGPGHSLIVRRRNRNRRRVRLDGVVFDSDNRVVFDPGNAYPWRCIGKLMVWNDPNSFFWDPPSKNGTAALVGRNFVLTSSHLVPDRDRWKGIFLPGLFDSRRSFGLFSYVETSRRYNPYDQGSDLAILKLFDPIGDTLGFFGSRVYQDAWEDGNYWIKAGYPSMPGNYPPELHRPVSDYRR